MSLPCLAGDVEMSDIGNAKGSQNNSAIILRETTRSEDEEANPRRGVDAMTATALRVSRESHPKGRLVKELDGIEDEIITQASGHQGKRKTVLKYQSGATKSGPTTLRSGINVSNELRIHQDSNFKSTSPNPRSNQAMDWRQPDINEETYIKDEDEDEEPIVRRRRKRVYSSGTSENQTEDNMEEDLFLNQEEIEEIWRQFRQRSVTLERETRSQQSSVTLEI